MFNKDKIPRKFPNFSETIHLNLHLIPNYMFGFNKTVNMNAGKLFGALQTNISLTSKVNFISSLPLLHGNAAVQTSLNIDTFGRLKGNMRCKVSDNLIFRIWGKQEFKGCAIASLVEWSGHRHNVNAELSVGTNITNATFSVSEMFRLNNRWSIVDQLIIKKEATSDCWWTKENVSYDYRSVLRYDNERQTVTAELDKVWNPSFQYQYRFNDALTVGALVSADVKQKTAKMTWLHRAKLGGGLEIKGRLDTSGMIVENVRKVLLSNNYGSLVVGASTSLNYKKKTMGFGIEVEINIDTAETKA